MTVRLLILTTVSLLTLRVLCLMIAEVRWHVSAALRRTVPGTVPCHAGPWEVMQIRQEPRFLLVFQVLCGVPSQHGELPSITVRSRPMSAARAMSLASRVQGTPRVQPCTRANLARWPELPLGKLWPDVVESTNPTPRLAWLRQFAEPSLH